MLTQCKSIDNLKLEGESTFTIQQIEDGVSLDIKNLKGSWTNIVGNDYLTEKTIKGMTVAGVKDSMEQCIIRLRYVKGAAAVLEVPGNKHGKLVSGKKNNLW